VEIYDYKTSTCNQQVLFLIFLSTIYHAGPEAHTSMECVYVCVLAWGEQVNPVTVALMMPPISGCSLVTCTHRLREKLYVYTKALLKDLGMKSCS